MADTTFISGCPEQITAKITDLLALDDLTQIDPAQITRKLKIDTLINLLNSAGRIILGANFQITSGLVSKWEVQTPNANYKLSLANDTRFGMSYFFNNIGAIAFTLYYPDTTTPIVTVQAGETVLVTANNDNGALVVYTYFLSEDPSDSLYQRIGYNLQTIGTNYTLTNPLARINALIPTADNLRAILPVMNAANSAQPGTDIVVWNLSNSPGHTMTVYFQDNSSLLATLAPLQLAVITIGANATENGTLVAKVYGTLASQNADNVSIAGGAINNTVIGGLIPALANFTQVFCTNQSNGLQLKSLGSFYASIVAEATLNTTNRTWGLNFGDTDKTFDISVLDADLVVSSLGGAFIEQTDPAVMRQFLVLGSDDNASFGTITAKQQTGFSGGDGSRLAEGVQTTDATPTVISSIQLPEGASITVTGQITGAKSDHTQAVGGTFSITARRQTGGNVTLVGSVVTNVQSTSAATFSCGVDTGTQTVRVIVTGVAANTYNWVTDYTLQRVLTNA